MKVINSVISCGICLKFLNNFSLLFAFFKQNHYYFFEKIIICDLVYQISNLFNNLDIIFKKPLFFFLKLKYLNLFKTSSIHLYFLL